MPRHASVLCIAAILLVHPASRADDARTDFDVLFVPEKDFCRHIPEYVSGNIGFFSLHWDDGGACTRATVLIASDATQVERIHAIREEITQALGLMQDSWTHPESICYQGWTPGVRFAEIDKTLVRMLYHPGIRPDMTREQAEAILKDRYSRAQIDYFNEIAFGSEYGEDRPVIHKWLHGPTLSVSGQLSDLDVRTVHRVVKELNALLGGIQLRIVRWAITPVPKA